MTVTFNFVPYDAQSAPLDATLVSELQAAAKEWTSGLAGNGTINAGVEVNADGHNTATPIFLDWGTDDRGRDENIPRGVLHANSPNAFDEHSHSFDMKITVDPSIVANDHNNEHVALFAHLIGHGLGIEGFFDPKTHQFDPKLESNFDAHVSPTSDGGWVFTGTNAGTVPLFDNGEGPYHFAHDAQHQPDLMDVSEPNATVSPLDFAVLADLGYDIDPAFLPSG